MTDPDQAKEKKVEHQNQDQAPPQQPTKPAVEQEKQESVSSEDIFADTPSEKDELKKKVEGGDQEKAKMGG